MANSRQIEQLQQAVIDALATGTSQNQLARQIGVSAATLINVKTANWKDVSESMVQKLRSYFRLDNWGIRNTHNFKSIIALCEDARDNKRMVATAGYTGAGKTTALRYFSDKNPTSFYVLATVIHTKRSFLASIQKAMGINEGSSIAEMMEGIINKMNSTRGAILIIDDGGKLSQVCLRLLQVIYDRTEYNAGIVLAGTEYLKDNLDKLSRKNAMGFRELRRRIAYWQGLRAPNKAVIAAICKDYGIVDRGAVAYIVEKATNYGTLRNLVLNAAKVYEEQGIAVDREVLIDIHVGDYEYEAHRA